MNLKHGMSPRAKRLPLYTVWVSMRQRCNNKNAPDYKNYGARGVSVCEEWNAAFMPFLEWAMANNYKHGLELDRIDNDGNYCPANCKFVTRATNSCNRRTNRLINGIPIIVHSRNLGGARNLVSKRLAAGWNEQKAITTQVIKRR